MQAHGPIRFDSRDGFVEALLTLVSATRHELVLVDHDFHDWPISTRAGCELLDRMLQGSRSARLRLLVVDAGWLEREAARFGQVRARHAAAVDCRQIPPRYASGEAAAIGDGRHLLWRAHRDFYRGRLCLDSPADAEPVQGRYQALWDESTPCLPGTTLGL